MSILSDTPQAVRSTTSIPAPKPPAPRSSRGPRRTPGPSSLERTPRDSAWERATWCASSRPRGRLEAKARISGIKEGVVFAPFHYGYFDSDVPDGHPRAANELTMTEWDPASK